MIKLLICLSSALAIGMSTLSLRHQQLELRHQNAELHDRIRSQQAKLWNQQLQIAVFTAPSAITETVKGHQIDMVPEFVARAPAPAESIEPVSQHAHAHRASAHMGEHP